jgi:hypothetical protein
VSKRHSSFYCVESKKNMTNFITFFCLCSTWDMTVSCWPALPGFLNFYRVEGNQEIIYWTIDNALQTVACFVEMLEMICFIVAYFTLNGQDALTTQQLIQESRHFCFFFKLKIKSISRSGKFKCANGKIKFTKKKKKKN